MRDPRQATLELQLTDNCYKTFNGTVFEIDFDLPLGVNPEMVLFEVLE